MRASADCLQIAANSASPWKKLPACALEFTGRVEIWTPTRYLEDTRFRLDEPLGTRNIPSFGLGSCRVETESDDATFSPQMLLERETQKC